ncbi:hypothetical protein KM043_012063 [Ampulex compressa]|nr:hypothetical protein KM043_012063 [Ampulex compressa]
MPLNPPLQLSAYSRLACGFTAGPYLHVPFREFEAQKGEKGKKNMIQLTKGSRVSTYKRQEGFVRHGEWIKQEVAIKGCGDKERSSAFNSLRTYNAVQGRYCSDGGARSVVQTANN